MDIGNVRPLRPLRVLVVARDARFGRVAGFLLSRRGFEVESLPRPNRVMETVARGGVDVLILDASGSLSEAARTAASLEALYPHITTILVSDEPRVDGVPDLLPKWTSLETLALNLEAMHLGLAPF